MGVDPVQVLEERSPWRQAIWLAAVNEINDRQKKAKADAEQKRQQEAEARKRRPH
ncbi:hypothetical protein GCM10009771_12860 [Nesterenkonia flava]